MSEVSIHDYLDRAESALTRIEAALARRREQTSDAPRADGRDEKLREEVGAVLGELDSLIARAGQ